MQNIVIYVHGEIKGFVSTDEYTQKFLGWRTTNLDNARRYDDMKAAIIAENEFRRQGHETQKLLVL